MKIKALVVDDMRNWRNLNKELLEKLFDDIEIETAVNASEAYNFAVANLQTPYDIIITDLQMENDYEPEHAGEWLVRELKNLKQYQNTIIIIVSASGDIRIVAENLNVEAIPKSTLVYDYSALKLKLEENGFYTKK